ncbi:MAG: pitrilysin family protein [Ignavibacteria bacterium]|nr:pitrilysin family protein [Ignavibacteria bacterium]
MKSLTAITSIFVFVFTSLIIPQNQALLADKDLITGTLANGIKYYIKKNQKPEKRAELRLFVNAGSTLENDDQEGLAHFVEHMAFNGTKNFKKNELINYLEKLGIKFGPELNAYTSFDQTVYMLTVPTDSVDILANGFKVLEEWAHNLSFDTLEIDKERGVVIEEWRLGRSADMRMFDKQLPILFKDSRYAERLPIGKKEIIESAHYETIINFYKDWYRPDLMKDI